MCGPDAARVAAKGICYFQNDNDNNTINSEFSHMSV